MSDTDMTLIEALQTFTTARSVMKNDASLIDATKDTSIEPLCIISRNVVNLDSRKDILSVMLNLFSSYYLQAVTIYGNINKVKILKAIDRFNPNRDLSSVIRSMESYHDPESYEYSLPMGDVISVEDDKSNPGMDLAVGKKLRIKMTLPGEDAKGKETVIPVELDVTVKLNVVPISPKQMVNIVASKTSELSFNKRFHQWRMGNISLVKDLILCQDIIDARKKDMSRDDSEVIKLIQSKVNDQTAANFLTAIDDKNFGMAISSNLYIISQVEAAEIATKLNGKWSNKSIREQIFKGTYAMIIAVVDSDYETVTFYFRGQTATSTLALGDIKKKQSTDILEMFKSLNSGSNINF